MKIFLLFVIFISISLNIFFILKNNSTVHTLSGFDLNDDDRYEIDYEEVENGYYELIDRNFDGKKDESNFYNLSNRIQSAKYDFNYDGILESKAFFDKGGLYKSLYVDSDGNGVSDIIFIYESGVLTLAKKYYKDKPSEGLNSVGEIEYSFNYPEKNEIYSLTNLSEEDFLKN